MSDDHQPFIDRLRVVESYDSEVAHSMADVVLLDALRAAGWGDVADAWEQVSAPFWYA